ncbi:MAG: hypothetical protein LKJ45_00475 [Oscillospiraceae bacterium]|nr:hypothetical protein [Oscillospiraceae bacterium]
MRIQHNIMALNASNRLKSNDNAISKNIAKLSSGYRINSAADDAAGLAVSEKMRAQINGLNQAEDNAQNGVSLIQTAEGGLNETEAILQRMNTLAVESANGTYQDGTDRANLQKEVTALKSEIDRISTSTNFNQINLLDGSLGSTGTAAAAKVELSNNVKGAAYGFVDSTAGVFTSSAAVTPFATTAKVGDTSTVNVKFTDGTGTEFTKTITLELTTAGDGSSTNGTVKVVGMPTLSATGTDNTNPVATDMGKLLMDALNADSDVSGSFDVTNATGTLTFTAKTKGADGAKITGLTETQNVGGVETDEAQGIAAPVFGTDSYEETKVDSLKVYDGTNLSDAVFTVNGESFVLADTAADVSVLDSSIHVVSVATNKIDDGSNDVAGTLTDGNGASEGYSAALSKAINDATGLSTSVSTVSGHVGNITYKTAPNAPSTNGITFQIGSENKKDQTVSLSIGDMSSKGLGITNVSIKNQKDAKAAIDTIKSAINMVSATRANLGALQNRLEHTENNLSTMSQNLTSAESNIRDVDMSDEYVQYSKNQILSQAATAMLTQANAQPQNVLSLLKG